MCRPLLSGRSADQVYSAPCGPLPLIGGSVTTSKGSGSRSDHFSGWVGSQPSLVTYWYQVPGCGAQAL